MKRSIFLFLTLVLSACIAQPTPEPIPTASSPFVIKQEENPYAPIPEDTSKRRGEVLLTSMNLSERAELIPLQNELRILGSMPSTCSELRIKVNPPNDTYQIFIKFIALWIQT